MASYEKYIFENKQYYKVRVKKRDNDGNQISKASKFTKSGKRIVNLNVASRVAQNLQTQLEKELGLKAGYTFGEWHKHVIKRMKVSFMAATVQGYNEHFIKWVPESWRDKDLGNFTNSDVHEFIFGHIPSIGGTKWVQKNTHKRLHRVFEMAVDERLISINPAKGIKVSIPEFNATALRDDEVLKLLSEGKRHKHPFYPHWVAAVMSGMRNGELYALTWDKISLKNNYIDINEQFTKKDGLHLPKKKRVRIADLNPHLKQFLLELKRGHGSFEETMWKWGDWSTDASGELVRGKVPVHKANLVLPRINEWKNCMQAGALRKFCEKIGIRSIRFHDLRASHITNLLENGMSITKVMKHVGHSRMSTTDQYNDLSSVRVKGTTEVSSFEMPTDEDVPDNVVSLFGS